MRLARQDELPICLAIRHDVFIVGQGVPYDEEVDGLDPDCPQFLAHSEGQAVGTARLLRKPDYAKAQRVAVLASARRTGVGAALMDALEGEARRLGYTEVRLDAQCEVIPFYETLGYVAEGPVFLDANIEHRLMRKAL